MVQWSRYLSLLGLASKRRAVRTIPANPLLLGLSLNFIGTRVSIAKVLIPNLHHFWDRVAR